MDDAAWKERFSGKEFLSEGTFARVFSYVDATTGERVAMKKVWQGKRSEGVAMPGYAELHSVVPRRGRLNLVMDLCATDLEMVLLSPSVAKPLPVVNIKLIMRMLLSAVDHCHRSGFLHQDIKPGNLLVAHDGTIKLADFGLAVKVDAVNPRLFHQVVTLLYRAPELLMGTRRHGAGVDMWSCGVILGELLLGKALFEGTSELGILFTIIGVLGPPTLEKWPGMAALPNRLQFGDGPHKPWEDMLPGAPPAAIDLVSRLLVYDPEKRPTAAQALEHPFFHREEGDTDTLSFMPAVLGGLEKPDRTPSYGPPPVVEEDSDGSEW